MRILLITQWFQPEPMLKGLPFARKLVELGHEVQVLTGFPNYPSGRLYPGYTIRPLMRESIQGVSVIRVPLFPSHDKSVLGRSANYASYALTSSTVGAIAARSADVAYVYHPPATAGLAAIAMRFLRGVPFVYDVNDLWPDTLSATGMLRSPAVLRAIGVWCRAVYRAADHVVVAAPGFKRKLIERGVPARKVSVIFNWCDDSVITPLARDPALVQSLGLADRFTVVFAGNMGLAQHLETVLTAAAQLRSDRPNIRFLFVGDGVQAPRLKEMAARDNLTNVSFIEQQPMDGVARYLALADVLLVHLKDDPLFRITIPSKIQAYLAAGRPLLAAVRGDAADLVNQSGGGVTCDPEDPTALADRLRALSTRSTDELHEMAGRGRDFYNNNLALSIGTQRFVELFAAVRRSKTENPRAAFLTRWRDGS